MKSLLPHIPALLFYLTACASTVTRDPSSNWVRESEGWAYCHDDKGDPHNCTEKEVEQHMIDSDYVRYHREVVGLIDRNASSTPSYEIEKEMIFLQSGLRALSEWQSYLNASSPDRKILLKKVPELRNRANLYARKIMELRSHHLVSHLFISRVQELSGFGLPSEIAARIPAGAKFWQFTFNPSADEGTYFLHDFRGLRSRLATEKRGGATFETVRAVCAGLLLCFGGIRGDDELVFGLDNLIGIQIIQDGGTAKIKGLYNRLFTVPCGSGGIFDRTSGIYNPDCGKQFVKIDEDWQETY